MDLSPQSSLNPQFVEALSQFLNKLPDHPNSQLIQRSLSVLMWMASEEIERADWKIVTATLQDLEKAFIAFYPHRHTRKVTIFGSARILPESAEYQLAVKFARCLADLGFMVLTGAGGGIMQAGNEGATKEHSFGLNIDLPFENNANEFIADDPKLINFKYFFTRKLFFLRESDAIALFPGGFGTQDEAFETLTLCQTGKYGPVPLVLIDEPDGDYWKNWQSHLKENLLEQGLISPDDFSLYTITNSLEEACSIIQNFYCVYHYCRQVNETLVMRLNWELEDDIVQKINQDYQDILISGKIEKSRALAQEKGDSTEALPRLIFKFNRQRSGRLYQLINEINQYGACLVVEKHPEYK